MHTASEEIASRVLELERELEKARRYRDKWQGRCSELESDLDAFRRVAAQMDIDLGSAREEAQPSTGNVARIVREAVDEIEEGEDFTVNTVKAQRREELASVPTSSVSRVLIRMQRDEEVIDLVRRGSGKRPSVYRRPKTASAPETETEGGDVTPFRRAEGGG